MSKLRKRLLKLARQNNLLIIILLIACFFRFYNYQNLQFWSADEEIMALTARKLSAQLHPPLIVSNSSLQISLGPYFHWLTGLLLLLFNHSPVLLLLFGSALGIFTTFVLYLTTKHLANKYTATITSFLYASSFLASLFDRRWWPLSLDSLFVIIAIFATTKLLQHKYFYLIPLTIITGFSFHADPSLVVIPLATLITLVLTKTRLPLKKLVSSFIIILLFLAPLAFFEFRHSGTITGPIHHMLTHSYSNKQQLPPISLISASQKFITNHSKGLFAQPSTTAEAYLSHGDPFNDPFFSPIAQLLVLAILFLSPLLINKSSNPNHVKVINIYQITFFLGLFYFTRLSRGHDFQQYFSLGWPILFLQIAYLAEPLFTPKLRPLLIGLALFYFGTNTYSLINSSITYSLPTQWSAVSWSITKLTSDNFAIYSRADWRFDGLGGLYYLNNAYPKNLSYFTNWDWIYKAYSLYNSEVGGGPFDNLVYYSSTPNDLDHTTCISNQTNHFHDLFVTIINQPTPECVAHLESTVWAN